MPNPTMRRRDLGVGATPAPLAGTTVGVRAAIRALQAADAAAKARPAGPARSADTADYHARAREASRRDRERAEAGADAVGRMRLAGAGRGA